MLWAWFGLCLSSLMVSLVSFRRRGLVGFCFGLLSMLGAALCFFFNFGVWVAFDDPLGPFQRDSLLLNGLGITGLRFLSWVPALVCAANQPNETEVKIFCGNLRAMADRAARKRSHAMRLAANCWGDSYGYPR